MAASGFTHEPQNSKQVDWYTPKWIFEKLGIEFDLDPCQPEGGIAWIPAKKHYSIRENGLRQPWNGRVWLNPPYGRLTEDWLIRMHHHRDGIALVFARTDCAWFHDYVTKADAILFLKGRLGFLDSKGVAAGAGRAACGSMLIAWGDENMRALHQMRDCGHFVCNLDF